jgi:flagellar L-ring protein precursor FlgH
VDITTPTFGGDPITFNGNELSVGIETENEFEGESKGNQSNSLKGSISVNVVQVLANGNLVVRGEKWITINNGDEYLRLTGIIRPEDIDPSNAIESHRVANARIQYSGTGAFMETQEQGWLTRFFSSPVWPL